MKLLLLIAIVLFAAYVLSRKQTKATTVKDVEDLGNLRLDLSPWSEAIPFKEP